MKHRTAKGKEFNMQAFSSGRGKTVAVGNSSLNAQGDLLGPNAEIIATRQEIVNRLHDVKSSVGAGGQAEVGLAAAEKEVSRKEVVGADGVTRHEVAYADGSMEIVDIPKDVKETKKGKKTDTGEF
jgi:hypothetical protein